MQPASAATNLGFGAEGGVSGIATVVALSAAEDGNFFREGNYSVYQGVTRRWCMPPGQLLVKSESEIGLDKLEFYIIGRIDKNQMVGFRLCTCCGYPPIDHLIVSGIQFVGDALRLAMLKLAEFFVIQ